jgi:hypothetical protein
MPECRHVVCVPVSCARTRFHIRRLDVARQALSTCFVDLLIDHLQLCAAHFVNVGMYAVDFLSILQLNPMSFTHQLNRLVVILYGLKTIVDLFQCLRLL